MLARASRKKNWQGVLNNNAREESLEKKSALLQAATFTQLPAALTGERL